MSDAPYMSNMPNVKKGRCITCGKLPSYKYGRAGHIRSRNFTAGGDGPFCDECWDKIPCYDCQGTGKIAVKRNKWGVIDWKYGTPTEEKKNCVICRGIGRVRTVEQFWGAETARRRSNLKEAESKVEIFNAIGATIYRRKDKPLWDGSKDPQWIFFSPGGERMGEYWPARKHWMETGGRHGYPDPESLRDLLQGLYGSKNESEETA